MTLTPTQARALASLLGQYQELLETSIYCEEGMSASIDGPPSTRFDRSIAWLLKRDRRRLRACEEFQKLLAGKG